MNKLFALCTTVVWFTAAAEMRYLYDASESVTAEYDSVVKSHPVLGTGEIVAEIAGGASVKLAPGSYLIDEEIAPGIVRTRYLAVADRDWTVLQLTVGAFTGDYMDAIFHSARVPVVYYVGPDQAKKDPTFLGWERDYGDDILLHLQPNTFAKMDPKWKTTKANWSELTEDEIVERLKFTDEWMRRIGYRPLSGFASYTPDNQLIRAMRKLDWHILHSIIPEQNWSDGHWAINHWGMPNTPFYIAPDDFRKQISRGEAGPDVIGMTMNTYHPLIPHYLYWGDFVLSPSHFIRSQRTLETGYYPERYRNFFEDYLKARTLGGSPFFLVTGYEFGRTLGTRMMMVHNRKGGEIALELAKKNGKVVFATARDCAAWYEKFEKVSPETCFALRDYWTGSRQMDKEVNVGAMISCEMKDWKAVFEHLNPLPYYHYDYTIKWNFAARDTSAPADFAEDDKLAVKVETSGAVMKIAVKDPLVRPVPVALWDAQPADASFADDSTLETSYRGMRLIRPAVISDARHHSVLILPKGWKGTLDLPLARLSRPDAAEFEGLVSPLWRVQSIGESRPHVYVTLSSPVLEDVTIKFTCPKDCRIDAPDKPLGKFRKGDVVDVTFGPSRNWYRFYGLSSSEAQPDAKAVALLEKAVAKYAKAMKDGPAALAGIHAEQDAWYAKLVPANEKMIIDVDCFGNKIYGQRSRAEKFDRKVKAINDIVDVKEFADGGVAFGPGKTLWENPQTLMFQVMGLDSLLYKKGQKIVVRFTSWVAEDPSRKRTYIVRTSSAGEYLDVTNGEDGMLFDFGGEMNEKEVCTLKFDPESIKEGKLAIILRSYRPAYLEDWYMSGGFMASVDRVIVTLED